VGRRVERVRVAFIEWWPAELGRIGLSVGWRGLERAGSWEGWSDVGAGSWELGAEIVWNLEMGRDVDSHDAESIRLI
jgi:hypothetical protein